jgi:chemotaxis response regulator CheB
LTALTLLGHYFEMPTVYAHVLVLSISPTLQRQIKERLVSKGLKFIFLSTSTELITTADANTKMCIIDIDYFKQNLFVELKALRKALGKKPIFAFGTPDQSKSYEIKDLHKAGIDEYFERTDVWNNPSLMIERIKTYVKTGRPKIKRETTMFRSHHHFAAILIGASTGGPEVLQELLEDFPKECPPIVVVQHIEANFASQFFDEMCKVSGLEKGKISEGETLERGHLYMATSDMNIGIKKSRAQLALTIDRKKQINKHRPSVDFLFNSATAVNDKLCAILLTGLGADGSRPMAALKKRGAYTMVQDKDSSPVFGMPEEAIKVGAAIFVGNPQEMRKDLFKRL